VRPNPHAVVQRGELAVHLFGMDGFDPADSYGSVIITVPDPDALYASFVAGLRAAYGRLPVAGIPRIVRPRKRWGSVYERGRALLYRAELEIRLGRTGGARASLEAADSLDLDPDERSALADDLAHVTELLAAAG
jgi:hypothetical protein